MSGAQVAPPSALALGRLLAAGALDPRAACEQALARAGEPAARHAFVALTPERARREAAASAARLRGERPASPLDGVPVAWKDLFDVAGTPTTAASATRREAPPADADAPVVARLAAAGLVCVGKTNLSELAFSGLGLNALYGTPANPCGSAADARVPGGSSAGAAVAVAAGVVPCAIGTDTSGSVRIPAAFCGLVGFRPSSARVERRGMLPLAPSLAAVGAIARTVADVRVLDALLRGAAPRPACAPEPAALRLAVPAGELVDDAAEDVRACFEAALERLQAAGVRVERRPLPALARAQALIDEHGSVVAAEAFRTHERLLAGPARALLEPRVRRRLEGGRAVLEHGLAPLLAARAALQAELEAQLDGALLAFPTVRHTAPPLAPLERDDELFARVNNRTLRSTMLGSYLDLPGVSLPAGHGEDELPVGLLLSGPPASDERTLDAALALETVLASAVTPESR